MAQYQRLFRLKPIGAHCARVEELLTPLLSNCLQCTGIGITTWKYGLPCHCQACDSLGRLWSVPTESVSDIRQSVIYEFPDAGATSPGSGYGQELFGFDDQTFTVYRLATTDSDFGGSRPSA